MVALCVDPTLNGTGLAVYDSNNDVVLHNDIINFNGSRKKWHKIVPEDINELDFKLKMYFIGEVIDNIFKQFPIDIVIYERSYGTNPKGITYVGMVTGLILGIARKYGVYDFADIHAMTAKKVITGKGNASKKEVQKELKKRYPYVKFKGYDDSDALAMGIAYFHYQNWRKGGN